MGIRFFRLSVAVEPGRQISSVFFNTISNNIIKTKLCFSQKDIQFFDM